jgi:hypothetical protein
VHETDEWIVFPHELESLEASEIRRHWGVAALKILYEEEYGDMPPLEEVLLPRATANGEAFVLTSSTIVLQLPDGAQLKPLQALLQVPVDGDDDDAPAAEPTPKQ